MTREKYSIVRLPGCISPWRSRVILWLFTHLPSCRRNVGFVELQRHCSVTSLLEQDPVFWTLIAPCFAQNSIALFASVQILFMLSSSTSNTSIPVWRRCTFTLLATVSLCTIKVQRKTNKRWSKCMTDSNEKEGDYQYPWPRRPRMELVVPYRKWLHAGLCGQVLGVSWEGVCA